MKGAQIIKISFDDLENHSPITEEVVITLVEDQLSHLSVHGKAAKWIASMPAEKFYLGYDGKVYPKYIVKRIEVG